MDCHLCTSSSSVVILIRLLACKELVSQRAYPTLKVYSGLPLWPCRVHRCIEFDVRVFKVVAGIRSFEFWTLARIDRNTDACRNV